jgi:hypothetical protein
MLLLSLCFFFRLPVQDAFIFFVIFAAIPLSVTGYVTVAPGCCTSATRMAQRWSSRKFRNPHHQTTSPQDFPQEFSQRLM